MKQRLIPKAQFGMPYMNPESTKGAFHAVSKGFNKVMEGIGNGFSELAWNMATNPVQTNGAGMVTYNKGLEKLRDNPKAKQAALENFGKIMQWTLPSTYLKKGIKYLSPEAQKWLEESEEGRALMGALDIAVAPKVPKAVRATAKGVTKAGKVTTRAALNTADKVIIKTSNNPTAVSKAKGRIVGRTLKDDVNKADIKIYPTSPYVDAVTSRKPEIKGITELPPPPDNFDLSILNRTPVKSRPKPKNFNDFLSSLSRQHRDYVLGNNDIIPSWVDPQTARLLGQRPIPHHSGIKVWATDAKTPVGEVKTTPNGIPIHESNPFITTTRGADGAYIPISSPGYPLFNLMQRTSRRGINIDPEIYKFYNFKGSPDDAVYAVINDEHWRPKYSEQKALRSNSIKEYERLKQKGYGDLIIKLLEENKYDNIKKIASQVSDFNDRMDLLKFRNEFGDRYQRLRKFPNSFSQDANRPLYLSIRDPFEVGVDHPMVSNSEILEDIIAHETQHSLLEPKHKLFGSDPHQLREYFVNNGDKYFVNYNGTEIGARIAQLFNQYNHSGPITGQWLKTALNHYKNNVMDNSMRLLYNDIEKANMMSRFSGLGDNYVWDEVAKWASDPENIY